MFVPSLKSEFLKLFTVRSTYILIIISVLLTVLFAFYFEGWRGVTGSPAANLQPTALKEVIANGAGLSVLFASIIAVLFMAHEYRYNVISYTVTINSRRSKVLLAKLLTIVSFGVVYGVVMAALALGCYMAGLAVRDASLPAQDLSLWAELGKVAFYFMGYAVLGFLLAVIVRSVVGAIAALFIISIVVEPLLTLVLKENSKYMPTASLDSTVGASMIQSPLSAGAAMLVSGGYLAAGLIAAWILFVRRDAS